MELNYPCLTYHISFLKRPHPAFTYVSAADYVIEADVTNR